ncbi:MAG: DUF2726 domain-containing protein [Opitutae bacterium]|nr:DUF2726 domain-containing protein [Opitutae bacterium]
MTTLFLIVIILVVIATAFAALLTKKKTVTTSGPKFRKLTALLSPAERQFFAALRAALPEAEIFPKVRVADVVEPCSRTNGEFSRISQKHFDWVICAPDTFEPLVAVELDDSSHKGQRQQERDATKNSAAADAGLPLLRFRCQTAYSADEIRASIAEHITGLEVSQ